MTTTHKVTVHRTYEITIELPGPSPSPGSPPSSPTDPLEVFISYMDGVASYNLGHGLDSLDAGDAVGAVLEATHLLGVDATWSIDEPLTIKITSAYEDDLFEWAPPTDSPS